MQCRCARTGGTNLCNVSPEWRRKANLEANRGRERKDLYTDNWYALHRGWAWILCCCLTIA